MTIALCDPLDEVEIDMSSVTEVFYRDSGAGGQHRNKTDSACRLTHPNGIVVCSAQERSQWQNRQIAWNEMERRLKEAATAKMYHDQNVIRVSQLNDKGWTWTQWRDEVIDRSTGKRARYSDLMKGKSWGKMI